MKMIRFSETLNYAIIRALIVALTVSPSLGAGILATKQQSIHSDASADIIVYQEAISIDSIPFVLFKTARGEVRIDRVKIVAVVEVPNSLPVSILEQDDITPIQKNLQDITDFSHRFPKAEKKTAKYIASLSVIIQKYKDGDRRLLGKWLSSQELSQHYKELTERAESERIAQQAELKRIAEVAAIKDKEERRRKMLEKSKEDEALRNAKLAAIEELSAIERNKIIERHRIARLEAEKSSTSRAFVGSSSSSSLPPMSQERREHYFGSAARAEAREYLGGTGTPNATEYEIEFTLRLNEALERHNGN
jgi:hypothetical protein